MAQKKRGGATDANYASRTLILNFATDLAITDRSSYAASPSSSSVTGYDSTDGVILNGTSSRINFADASRWTMGTEGGIEFKAVKVSKLLSGGTQYLVCQRTSGHPLWVLAINTNGSVQFFQSNSGGTTLTSILTASGVIADGSTHDIAVKRTGGVASIWIDGSNATSTTTPNTTGAYSDMTDPLGIGAQNGDNSVSFGGRIKGIRLTNGVTIDASSMPYPFPTS